MASTMRRMNGRSRLCLSSISACRTSAATRMSRRSQERYGKHRMWMSGALMAGSMISEVEREPSPAAICSLMPLSGTN